MQETTVPARGAKIKKCLLEAGIYAALLLLTLVLFLAVKPYIEVQRTGAIAQAFIAIGLSGCLALTAYLGITKRLTMTRIAMILLLMGFILRVGYMLYTPATARQQDTWTSRDYGHESYAWILFSKGELPSYNDYQFYHPPLNALVQAGFMKCMTVVLDIGEAIFGSDFVSKYAYGMPSYEYMTETRYFLYSSCQILAVMYSVITAVTMVKILSLFDFSERQRIVLYAFVIFFPRNIQFSGMLNNDGISFLFATLALYYALKWWKGNRKFVWIVLCAFAVGFGMMAKLSTATVCLPIAGIFIYEFVMTLMKKADSMPIGKMILQYGVFLLICAPIGLWFQVYAKIRFDQDFGFVFSNLNQKLYTGDHNLFERFIFPFDLTEFFGSLYCRPFEGNYYLFNYALRSAIFGEFSYWQGEGFAATAIVFAYLGAALLAFALIWCLVLFVKRRRSKSLALPPAPVAYKEFMFVFLLMQSQAVSEIYFYLKMPYGCTMDFRYIMPMILAIALTIGLTQKTLKADGGKVSVAISRLLTIVSVGFLVVSSLFYCVCI